MAGIGVDLHAALARERAGPPHRDPPAGGGSNSGSLRGWGRRRCTAARGRELSTAATRDRSARGEAWAGPASFRAWG